MNKKPHRFQTCYYRIQFFGYNQPHWANDVLSYRQYRDYMSKNLLSHYESYPQIKYQFLDVMNQADNANINEKTHARKSSNTSPFKVNYNYDYIPTSHSMMTGKKMSFISLYLINSMQIILAEIGHRFLPMIIHSISILPRLIPIPSTRPIVLIALHHQQIIIVRAACHLHPQQQHPHCPNSIMIINQFKILLSVHKRKVFRKRIQLS